MYLATQVTCCSHVLFLSKGQQKFSNMFTCLLVYFVTISYVITMYELVTNKRLQVACTRAHAHVWAPEPQGSQ